MARDTETALSMQKRAIALAKRAPASLLLRAPRAPITRARSQARRRNVLSQGAIMRGDCKGERAMIYRFRCSSRDEPSARSA